MGERPKNYGPLRSKVVSQPQVIKPVMPDVIVAPVYEYNPKECTLEGEMVDHKLVDNGKPTKFGQRMLDTQNAVAAHLSRLPNYLNRIAAMDGATIELPATNRHGSNVRDHDAAYYSPPQKKLVIPITSARFPNQIGGSIESIHHEMNHAVGRALGAMLPKNFAGEGSLSTDLSEHPLFAEAYKRDLAKIKDDPNRSWRMSLEHYLPQEKGGDHDNKYNHFTPRMEAFAELLALAQKGALERDKNYSDYGRNAYSNALKQNFPNMYAAVQKFHADMLKLDKQNPAIVDTATGIPNNEKYQAALKQYVEGLPKTPDAFLDKATVARLAALPEHKDQAKIQGTTEHMRSVAPADKCVDIKVKMKEPTPPLP